MRFDWGFVCPLVLLFTSAALGQRAEVSMVQPPASLAQSAAPAPSAAHSVPPGAPVITITGLCEGPAGQSAAKGAAEEPASKPCETVIARAEFDALTDAIQPSMSAADKVKLAGIYAKLLLMQREFRKLGLASDHRVQRALAFASLSSEADATARLLKEKSEETPPEAEIQQYYEQNRSSFEQIDLQRIYIPDDKTSESARRAAPQASTAEPYKPQFDALQARAAKGENFEALQAEVFKTAGIPGPPPNCNIGKFSDSEIPSDLRAVAMLKPGEVSQVFPGPNGSYIYKLVSRSSRPLEEVRGDIRKKLADQHFTQSILSIENSAKVELNSAYFPEAAHAALGASGTESAGAETK